MPVVMIRGAGTTANGEEEVLSEYLCDHPGCPNRAEHVLGCAREIGAGYAVCHEHAAASDTDAA